MKELVTVLIVTHNSAHEIDDLLDSLPSAAGSVHYDTVIVDSGSTDETASKVSIRGDCVVLEASNIGYAAGLNKGISARPQSSYYLLLNPDVVLADGAIERMMAPFRNRSVGIVAPRIQDTDGGLTRSIRREPSVLRAVGLGRTRRPLLDEYVSSPREYTYGHPVDWALGAALMVSRGCIDRIGLLDESFFLYSEETEYCLRAREHGYLTWFEPTAVCTHIGGASGTTTLTHSIQVLNRVRLYRRRNNRVSSTAYFGLTLLGELSRWARGNLHSRTAVVALLVPRKRPEQLGASAHLIPK